MVRFLRDTTEVRSQCRTIVRSRDVMMVVVNEAAEYIHVFAKSVCGTEE